MKINSTEIQHDTDHLLRLFRRDIEERLIADAMKHVEAEAAARIAVIREGVVAAARAALVGLEPRLRSVFSHYEDRLIVELVVSGTGLAKEQAAADALLAQGAKE